MAMISCSGSQELNKAFSMPFVESANYLGMQYIGDIHTWIEEDSIPKSEKTELNNFIEARL